MKKNPDQEYMGRCLELASRGYGHVHPNPMVGSLIVKGGAVIAEGFHKEFGGPHAEVECLRKAGGKARGGTMYVNLEPCIHHGKTPPCVDAIVRSGIREVVVATNDPNPLVSGRGIHALRNAGIRVRTGVSRNEAEKLNRRFMWWHQAGVPFVGLKWAQSLDGFIADSSGRSKWITSPEARKYAHHLRSGYDGILVGAGTVLKDNPRLTARHVDGRDPVRVVLDGKLRVTGKEKVFRHRTGRTVLITSSGVLRKPGAVLRRLIAEGVEVLAIGRSPRIPVRHVLTALAGEGITSVLVEGGPLTLRGFLDAGAFNTYHVFIRPSLLRGGYHALPPRQNVTLKELNRMRGSDITMFDGGDLLLEGERIR